MIIQLYKSGTMEPRTKIIYSPVPGVRLWASSGLYSQFPDLMTIISRGEPMDITQRSENLKAEKAVHNILGFDWDMTENSYLKVEVYNRKISDLLVADEDSYLAENMGEGLANGIEFTLQNSGHLFLPYNFWANYSYSVAQYKRQDELHWTYLDFDQRHQSAAGLECDVSGNWSIGSVFRYGSGFPYTPVDGLQKDISTHGALDGWQIIKGAKNSRRYPIYSRVDLRITYKHKGNSWDMSAYLDFMNVLNNKNVYLYEWDFTSNSNSGVSLAKKNVTYMLPFVPSFGLNFQF